MFESGCDEIEPADESQNVSFLLTLLTTLDFTNRARCSRRTGSAASPRCTRPA